MLIHFSPPLAPSPGLLPSSLVHPPGLSLALPQVPLQAPRELKQALLLVPLLAPRALNQVLQGP